MRQTLQSPTKSTTKGHTMSRTIIQEAIELLEAPLTWSPDFEAIRYHLIAMLEEENQSLGPYEATHDLCEALLDGFDNDLTVG